MIINGRLQSAGEIKTTARNLHQLADDLLSTLDPDFPRGVHPEGRFEIGGWQIARALA